MDWAMAHWLEIVGIVGGVALAARVLLLVAAGIARLTATPKDDEVVGRAQGVFDSVVTFLKWAGLQIPERFTGTKVLLLLFLLPLLASCVAPAAVREAEVLSQVAMQNHLANDQRILDLCLGLYIAARNADLEFTTEQAIAEARSQGTPEEVEKNMRDLIAAREKVQVDTALVAGRVRNLVSLNMDELRKALKLSGKMSEWLAAGMDASAIPSIANEILGLANEMRGTKTPALP